MRVSTRVLAGVLTLVLAGASATASAERAEIPADFGLKWMRGLVLVDDPQGARVIVGNASREAGAVITRVNDQPVAGVADLLAKLAAADLMNVRIESTQATQAAAPADVWAETLRYRDTPGGVLITSSVEPSEVGFYLTELNGTAIVRAADVRPLLLQIVNDVSRMRTKTVVEPNAEDKAAVAAILAAAPTNTVPADVLARWGAFALFPGKVWYCDGSEPAEWLQRRTTNRITSLPVARLTRAEWVDDATIKVMTTLGNDTWTDLVTRRPDGTFEMRSTGVSAHANVTGRMEPNGEIRFRLGSYQNHSQTLTDYITYGHYAGIPRTSLWTYSGDTSIDGSICQMEEFDELKLPRFTRTLQNAREQAAQWRASEARTDAYTAQLEAEGAQMAAGMQASAMAEIANIAVVAADVQRQQAELERLRIAAEEETRRGEDAAAMPESVAGRTDAAGVASGTATAAPPPGSTAGAEAGPPIRFFYVAPMTPTATDTRNPMCYSNVVTLDQRLDGDSWTRLAKARPFVEPYWEAFLEKCRRLGNVEGRGVYSIEHLDSGWPPQPHPTDRRVTLP